MNCCMGNGRALFRSNMVPNPPGCQHYGTSVSAGLYMGIMASSVSKRRQAACHIPRRWWMDWNDFGVRRVWSIARLSPKESMIEIIHGL